MRGKVIRVMGEKGFGFIRGEDGTDRFFHRSGLQQTAGLSWEQIEVGAACVFEPIDGPKGPRAIGVQVR
jgi:CspA family cold shock protein